MLRLAACLEEHSHIPWPRVVEEAKRRGLRHEEYHSKVEYLVAHGIASTVNGERVLIGSAHFVFEDEGCVIPEGEQERFDALPPEYSHLYLAIGGQLAAVICISDPLREEAKEVLSASAPWGSPVLSCSPATATVPPQPSPPRWEWMTSVPESFRRTRRSMWHAPPGGAYCPDGGDGINDSPALSEADAALPSATARHRREIADITIAADSSGAGGTARIAMALMARIHSNYRFVIGFNGT